MVESLPNYSPIFDVTAAHYVKRSFIQILARFKPRFRYQIRRGPQYSAIRYCSNPPLKSPKKEELNSVYKTVDKIEVSMYYIPRSR